MDTYAIKGSSNRANPRYVKNVMNIPAYLKDKGGLAGQYGYDTNNSTSNAADDSLLQPSADQPPSFVKPKIRELDRYRAYSPEPEDRLITPQTDPNNESRLQQHHRDQVDKTAPLIVKK